MSFSPGLLEAVVGATIAASGQAKFPQSADTDDMTEEAGSSSELVETSIIEQTTSMQAVAPNNLRELMQIGVIRT